MSATGGATVEELRRPTVLVRPPDALRSRPRLFGALSEALDVEFAGYSAETAAAEARALISLEPTEQHGPPLPTIVIGGAAPGVESAPADAVFSDESGIDPALEGAVLPHRLIASLDLPDDKVIAGIGGVPVWTRRERLEYVGADLVELRPDETLRDRLSGAEFLPLIALVDFVRRCCPDGWTPPPPRATFLFDDPNLHSTSYGYVRYSDLIREGRRVGYHVAFAMIPLDTWWTSRRAQRVFRSAPDVLSLLVHGNDHIKRELGRPLPPDATRALLTCALQRIERFEARSGLHVSRVMAPPHGACSEEAASELGRLGYEALCISRPYPWLDRPPPDRVLAGWHPTEVVTGDLPVIPRLHLQADRRELVIRAFLRQPLVLFGHHEDLRHGLDVLADAAAQIGRRGGVSWLPLEKIARSSYDTRRAATTLHVRLHARRVDVPIPDGVDTLALDLSRFPDADSVHANGDTVESHVVSVTAGSTAEIVVGRHEQPATGVRHRSGAWPYARRALTEARDRLLPLSDRAAVRRGDR